MVKRSLLVLALVLAVFTGYVVGQKDVQALPGGATVFSGDNFGFQADGRIGDTTRPGHGWVTGKFVVKVDGRWVEARMGAGVMPVR